MNVFTIDLNQLEEFRKLKQEVQDIKAILVNNFDLENK